jgi:hypothetical protein
MRLYLALTIAASAVIVSGCFEHVDLPKVEAKATVTVTAPAQSRIACEATPLPDRALGQAETTDLWSRDRGMIRTCDGRRAAAVSAIDAAGGVP